MSNTQNEDEEEAQIRAKAWSNAQLRMELSDFRRVGHSDLVTILRELLIDRHALIKKGILNPEKDLETFNADSKRTLQENFNEELKNERAALENSKKATDKFWKMLPEKYVFLWGSEVKAWDKDFDGIKHKDATTGMEKLDKLPNPLTICRRLFENWDFTEIVTNERAFLNALPARLSLDRQYCLEREDGTSAYYDCFALKQKAVE